MTNKEAVEQIELVKIKCEGLSSLSNKDAEALNIAIKALEEAQLDIKLLKMDLPELFRPSCDGGYLKEGEEQ